MTQAQQGFLLTRHWRDTAAGTEVEFWLATDSGPRRIRLAPQPSVAFIPAEQRERAESIIGRRALASNCGRCRFATSSIGRCSGSIASNIGNWPSLEKALKEGGVQVYEADIRPPERYLMERFITAPVSFSGTPNGDGPLLDAN